MTDWIGSTLSKVHIEKLVSRGGMAEVYVGRHTTLNRVVAVKILHSYLLDDPALHDRFRAEAQGVATLRHPSIIQVFDFDIANDQPYIVMEALDGPTLAEYLRVLHAGGGRLPLRAVARFVSALASALDYAHTRGIVHRDLKPANVILRSDGGRPIPRPPNAPPDDVVPVLTDFGLARMVNSALVSNSGTITGTPAYMSPEQARSDTVGSSSDIYSLGIILYELLTGQTPFRGDTPARLIFEHISQPPPPPRRMRPDLPEVVEAVVLRALAKNPSDRHETAGDMAAALGQALTPTLVLDADITTQTPESGSALPMTSIVPSDLSTTVADTARASTKVEDAARRRKESRPIDSRRRGPKGSPRTVNRAERHAAPRSRPGLTLAALLIGSVLVGAFSLTLISGEADRLLPQVASAPTGVATTQAGAGVAATTPSPATARLPVAIVATASRTPAPRRTAASSTATHTETSAPTASPTPPATPSQPFVDDFSQQLGPEWTVVRGHVGIVLGHLTLRDLIAGEVNEGVALVSAHQWGAVAIEAQVKNVAAADLSRFLDPGNAAAALLIRAAPDGSGLGLVIERTAVQFAVLNAEGEWTLLVGTRGTKGVIFDIGRLVRVEAVGDRYTAYVAGEEVTSVVYPGPELGRVGVWFRSIVANGLSSQVVPLIDSLAVTVLPAPPAGPAPTPIGFPAAFADNFDRGLRPQWKRMEGGWGIARDRLTLTTLLASEATTGLIAVDEMRWPNYSVEATIADLFEVSDEGFLFEGNSAVGLLARLQADGSGVGVVVERHALTLATRDADGNWTPLPDARVTGADLDTPHVVRLAVSGSAYTVYLDRVQVLSAVYAGGPADGGVGLWIRSAIPVNPAERTVVPKIDDFQVVGTP